MGRVRDLRGNRVCNEDVINLSFSTATRGDGWVAKLTAVPECVSGLAIKFIHQERKALPP